MTREEAINIWLPIIKTGVETMPECKEALDMAIKSLEQESVLDKVRAEINGMYRVILKGTPKDDWAVKWNECLDDVLQIIDKYR